MNCKNCGGYLDVSDKFCKNCGCPNSTQQNNNYYNPQQGQNFSGYDSAFNYCKESIELSKILGIVAIISTFVLPGIGLIVAWVCSGLGLSKIKNLPGNLPFELENAKKTAKTLNKTGLIISIVLAVIGFIIITLAIAFSAALISNQAVQIPAFSDPSCLI